MPLSLTPPSPTPSKSPYPINNPPRSFYMIPLTFLTGVLLVTLGTFLGHLYLRSNASEALRRLAAQRGMHFVGNDLFQITPRVVERFPIPGASDLRVLDVVYLREGDRYRYVFTIEYTLGVVRTKHRLSRAATFCEPRDRAHPEDWSTLILAPPDLSLLDQYAHLCAAADSTAAAA